MRLSLRPLITKFHRIRSSLLFASRKASPSSFQSNSHMSVVCRSPTPQLGSRLQSTRTLPLLA